MLDLIETLKKSIYNTKNTTTPNIHFSERNSKTIRIVLSSMILLKFTYNNGNYCLASLAGIIIRIFIYLSPSRSC